MKAPESAEVIVAAVVEGRIDDAETAWNRTWNRTLDRPIGQADSATRRLEDGWCRLARGLLLMERGDPSAAAEQFERGLEMVEVPEPIRAQLFGSYARALVRSNDVFGGLRALRSEISPTSVREPSLGLAIALAGIFDDVNAPESYAEILRWAVPNDPLGPPDGWDELTLGPTHLVGSYELFIAAPLVSSGQFAAAAALLDRAVITTPREQVTAAVLRAELARQADATQAAVEGLFEAAEMAREHGMVELDQLASLSLAGLLPPEQAAPRFGAVVGDRCFGRARRRYHEVGRSLADTNGDAQSAYLHQRALLEMEMGYRQFTLALSGGLGLFTSEAMVKYQQARVENRLARTDRQVADQREAMIELTKRLAAAIDGLDVKLADQSSLSPAAIESSIGEIESLLDPDDGASLR